VGSCGSRLAHKQTCSISCLPGFSLVGPSTRQCVGGALRGEQQRCVGNTCEPITSAIANGNAGSCSTSAPHGGLCTIQCNKGYAVKGSANLVCRGGQWTGQQTCAGNPCAALTIGPAHGSLGTCGLPIKHGGVCSFACEYVCLCVLEGLSCAVLLFI
jgi:hypothetical protein